MIKNFVLSIGLLCVALGSCVEVVDIDPMANSLTNKLAVEGSITNERKAHVVRLTLSRNAVSNEPPLTITGASVTISDGTLNFALHEISPGVYATDPDVRGEAGRTYTVTIVYNGNTYTASDVMPPAVPFNEGDNIFVVDKFLFGNRTVGFTLEHPLVTYGALMPVKTELKVLPAGAPGPSNNRSAFYYFPGIDSEGLVPTQADQLKFAYGDTVKQSKITLSEANYRFMRAVLLETKFYGGVLSAVPANVPTNLSNGAVGFFSASSEVSRKSVIK